MPKLSSPQLRTEIYPRSFEKGEYRSGRTAFSCLSVCVSDVLKMASKSSKYVTILFCSTLVAGEPTQLREKEHKFQREKVPILHKQ